MSKQTFKPRIAIFGPGQYGQIMVQQATEKGWPVVAAFNRAGAKVGQDLGRLSGLGRDLGVIVQDCETADYSAAEADIAIVAADDLLHINYPAYEKLMNAGMNVICHGTASIFPEGNDPETAAKIDDLAKRNKVTFTGGGIWDMSRVWSGLLAAGPCTHIDGFYFHSTTNVDQGGEYLMRCFGIDLTEAEFDDMVKQPGRVDGMYAQFMHLVIKELGYRVTGITEERKPIIFDIPVHCWPLNKDIEAGRCVGTRTIITVTTEEGVTATGNVELRLYREGEVDQMTWRVDGKPGSKITVERTDANYTTVSSMLNRIHDVIAAPPGIQHITRLGPMKHSALL